MSGKIMGQVWDLDLDHAELLVLLALTDHADHLGNNIYPSVGLVAWKCGYSERQVQRIIKTLVGYGILIQVGKTKQGVKSYRVDFTDAKKKPDFAEQRQNVTPPINEGDKMSPPTRQNVTPRGDIAMSPKPSYEPSVINQSSSLCVAGDDAVTLPTTGISTPAKAKRTKSVKRLFTAEVKPVILEVLLTFCSQKTHGQMSKAELNQFIKRLTPVLAALQPLDDEQMITPTELSAAFGEFHQKWPNSSYPASPDKVVKMLTEYRVKVRKLTHHGRLIPTPALDQLLEQKGEKVDADFLEQIRLARQNGEIKV